VLPLLWFSETYNYKLGVLVCNAILTRYRFYFLNTTIYKHNLELLIILQAPSHLSTSILALYSVVINRVVDYCHLQVSRIHVLLVC
jgi:hypothetical protein